MRVGLIGFGAMMAALAGCGEEPQDGTAAPTQGAGPEVTDNAQGRVEALSVEERNIVMIRAIRDAQLDCQQVVESSQSQTTNGLPVYMATCDNGAVYAVAVQDDGTAMVRPVTPATAGQ